MPSRFEMLFFVSAPMKFASSARNLDYLKLCND